MNIEDLTLDIEQSTDVKADIGDVFKGVLYRLGKGNAAPDGTSLNMVLEEWAGGRWFRDRGEGIQHLWGHLQVIKPPSLIELSGPMFMSYPALNHVEVKLVPVAGGTTLTLRHRAIGMIDPEHRKNISTGWQHLFDAVQGDLAKAAKGTS
ncbi:MAG TPA: SRPBCC domain-containing protein [Pyrinomonadaceae bacterium]|jgi:hypothetical protein|nr:SRPBCC domain-containing protein [Pyrinomonadaceae bacterium]